MNRMLNLFFPLLALVLFAGCKTTESKVRPLSWKQQQAYFATVRDPRIFGLGIYDTPAGVQIRGGGRLHPSQSAVLPVMLPKKETMRPVVGLGGSFGVEWPVLLDVSSRRSWFEYGVAGKLTARPVGEGRAVLTRGPDEEVDACLSVTSSLRLDQLFIENPLVYVRMAEGPLGVVARDIVDPEPKAVIGWDILGKFEQIRLLYSIRQIVLLTTDPFVSDPSLLVMSMPLVAHAGLCAVRGSIDGKDALILIDPAGDFEVATDDGAAVSSIQLGGLNLDSPGVATSPGGTRIGARLLQKYDVTICPQAGVIYFEKRQI